jgi:hypothetical protein
LLTLIRLWGLRDFKPYVEHAAFKSINAVLLLEPTFLLFASNFGFIVFITGGFDPVYFAGKS